VRERTLYLILSFIHFGRLCYDVSTVESTFHGPRPDFDCLIINYQGIYKKTLPIKNENDVGVER